MSTKYIENYKQEEWTKCIICGGDFKPGGTLVELPDGVCIWCFSRRTMYRRFTLLWKGLQLMATQHEENCSCEGCVIYRSASTVLLRSGTSTNELP